MQSYSIFHYFCRMKIAAYLILILIVGFLAIFSGFRRGITGQITSLLGFGFGAVTARILTPEFSGSFLWAAERAQAPEFRDFTANLVCGVVIYAGVYLIFSCFSGIVRNAMSVFQKGMINRLAGAFFSLVKNLLWVSIFYNLMLCFSARSGLLQFEKSNDGNPVSAVMWLTPAILGCYGAEDFAHFNQLKEAKSIS